MYRYSDVERALALAYDVTPEALGAFRGRIQHLQRVGIVPANPGRGRRIVYDLETVYRWAFCIELAEFGIDPTRIKIIVDRIWDPVRNALMQKHSGDPVLFVLRPMMLSKSISRHHNDPDLPFADQLREDLPFVSRASRLNIEHFRRALVINLTALSATVEAALRGVFGSPERSSHVARHVAWSSR